MPGLVIDLRLAFSHSMYADWPRFGAFGSFLARLPTFCKVRLDFRSRPEFQASYGT